MNKKQCKKLCTEPIDDPKKVEQKLNQHKTFERGHWSKEKPASICIERTKKKHVQDAVLNLRKFTLRC